MIALLRLAFDARIVTLVALLATSVRVAVDEVAVATETGIDVWSLAKTTGVLFAIVFCPSVLMRPVNVVDVKSVASVASVDAPVGNGKDAADTG